MSEHSPTHRPAYVRQVFDAVARLGGRLSPRLLLYPALYLALEIAGHAGTAKTAAVVDWNLALGFSLAVVHRDGLHLLGLMAAASLSTAVWDYAADHSALYVIWLGLAPAFVAGVPVFLARSVGQGGGIGFLRSRWAAVLLFSIPISLLAAVFIAGRQLIGAEILTDQFWDAVVRLWVGDLIGIFVIAPLWLLIAELWSKRRAGLVAPSWEVASQAVFMTALFWAVFVYNADNVREYFYVLSLPLIWISLRHGSRGAAVANTALLAAVMTFIIWFDNGDAQAAQLPARMLVLVTTALVLGMTVDEGRSAARRLRAREQELAAILKSSETSELAGTLAHELSHPLGAIANYSSVIKDKLDAHPGIDPALRDLTAKMRAEVRRATETIQRLREFYRSGSLRLEKVDLGYVVRDAVFLLSSKFETNDISIRFANPLAPTFIAADGIQIHSVIHNLLVNAIDALRGGEGSQKIVSVSVQRIGDKLATVTVEDSGPGIAPDIADHIFEPMATTKKHGLGLGLSMSKSIIVAHGGQIEVDRSAYGGARFTVTLPAELG